MKLLLISFITFFSTLTFAGHETGNGGGAVVCRDSQNKILSVELLDLWEARTLGNNLISGDFTKEDFLKMALTRTSQKNFLLGSHLKTALRSNEDIIVYLPSGVHLSPPTDAQTWLMKDGCSLESVAQYRTEPDRDILYINKELLLKMSAIDQAALKYHEAIYKLFREDDGDQTSVRARAATTEAFKDDNPLFMTASPNIACFHEISADMSKYSFAMLGAYENDSIQLWISRENTKWQMPAIRGTIPNPNQIKPFVQALKMDVSDLDPDADLPSILSLRVVFVIERKTVTMTGVLTPRHQATSGKAYNFSWYVDQSRKARCTVN